MLPYDWITQAVERITPHIRQTPLTYDPKNDLYLKWENHQVTGSFKVRGALNKVFSLQAWEWKKGLVTASAGNHGQGVALAARLVGAQVTVFASEHATPTKIEAMRQLGAQIRLVPGGYGEAERDGIEFATQSGATWISPYNDGQVIAGQATLGLETLSQLPPLARSTWVVPAGGGGLVSGIGAGIVGAGMVGAGPVGAGLRPAPTIPALTITAVSSEASPFLHNLYHRGTQEGVTELPSLADGLAGPVEPGSVTIPLIQQLVNSFVLVNEAEIAQAIAYAWHQYGERIEGSAAVALSAVLTRRVPDRPAVVILTGGNIQPELFEQVVRDASSII